MAEIHEDLGYIDDAPSIDMQRYSDAANIVTELTRLEAQARNSLALDTSREIGVFALLDTVSDLAMPEQTRTTVYDLILQSYAVGAAEAVARDHGAKLVIPAALIKPEGGSS